MPALRICTLLFAVGIFLANSFQICSSVIPLFFATGFLCIFIFSLQHNRRAYCFISLYPFWQTCTICTASLISGAALYLEAITLPVGHLSEKIPPGKTVTIAGEIQDLSRKQKYSEVILRVHKVYIDSLALSVNGLVRTQIDAISFTTGTHLLIAGKIAPIQSPRNPGQFNLKLFLERSNIHSYMDIEYWIPISGEKRFFSQLRAGIHQARQAIRSIIDQSTQTNTARTLLYALILGDQTNFPQDIKADFRESGISHVLAVSGLHVLCIALILYKLMRPFCLKFGMNWRQMETIRVIFTLSLLAIYACLTGLKPAVFRASLMTGIFILAPLLHRPITSLNSMYLAAFVVLVLKPIHLFTPGFQLSFSAVSCILYLYPRLPSLKPRPGIFHSTGRSLLSSFNVSIAALIGTLPVTLFHFKIASAGGLLLNILAIPATIGILFSGILMIIATPISPGLAMLFGNSAEVFSSILILIANNGAILFPAIHLPFNPQTNILFALTGILIFLIGSFTFTIRWSTVCVISSLFIITQWGPIVNSQGHPRLEIVFFDVGHGDAALIQFPNNRTLLIDTGDTPGHTLTNALAHFLHKDPSKCIDSIVLTHPDRDHTGGLNTILDDHCLHYLYTSNDHRYELHKENEYTHKLLTAGDTINIDPATRIKVLGPPNSLVNKKNINNGSLVLLIEFGFTRFLFSGDAEFQAEHHLVQHYPEWLSSNAIKVGHHGSSTSSTQAFIQHSYRMASFAVISTGKQSRYGLPDSLVVTRWQEAGAVIHNTALSGALWLVTDGQHVYKEDW